jgi:uncharacterized protein (TIGR00661 family)
MRFVFIIQGEGRGHMTQAISLHDMLKAAGHEVALVLVGKSARREIPAFLYEKLKAPIEVFESPNFVTDSKNKSIRLGATLWQNLLKSPGFFKQMAHMHRRIKSAEADVVVNFYDLLGGLYFLFYAPGIPYVCIGHQYLLLHPEFTWPKGRAMERFFLNTNTKITASRATLLLGLSFRPMSDQPDIKLAVVPPLLRKEVAELQPKEGDYLLGYMVNDGYSEEITHWHLNRQEVPMHCFYDKKGMPESHELHPNLTFHQLNDSKFLEKMEGCMGYASTAGFESICEAMYLGKPVCLVPTENQFEQACNALDAVASGAGITRENFTLDEFLDYIPKHQPTGAWFREWADSAPNRFLRLLEGLRAARKVKA